MKKILELKGVQKLSRKQQLKIKGAVFSGCCSANQCRVVWAGGSFCEPGRCSFAGCIFY
ncbi:hypothetical protein M0D21_21275 [Aquimarina sp. D1M17]|nr:hypothetical protein [Aquimarina acroporae]